MPTGSLVIGVVDYVPLPGMRVVLWSNDRFGRVDVAMIRYVHGSGQTHVVLRSAAMALWLRNIEDLTLREFGRYTVQR